MLPFLGLTGSVGNKENILKNMSHLTTSGSTFFARSWMALITIHIDDRRNMTPKITQALGKKKKRKKNNVKNIFGVVSSPTAEG